MNREARNTTFWPGVSRGGRRLLRGAGGGRATGHPHCRGAEAQFGGGGVGRQAAHGDAPERLPGPRLELAADQLQRPVVQAGQLGVAVVGQVGGVGELVELLLGVGAAGGLGGALAGAEMVEQLKAGDALEPAAEGVAGPVTAEAGQPAGHRPEHLLGDVLGVGPADAPVPAPGGHQRRVQPHQSRPGVRVAAAGALQQRQRGHLVSHGPPSGSHRPQT
jgi:hypothetical protein